MSATAQAWPVGQLPADLLTADVDGHTDVVLFLRALAKARTIPLTVPIGFNALAYRYDLRRGAYDPTLLEVDRLPLVGHDRHVDVVPVGSFVRLPGSQRFGCEVIARHAEAESVDIDGALAPWLSGAPAGANDPAQTHAASAGAAAIARPADGPGEITIRERLIVDPTVLDPAGARKLLACVGTHCSSEGHLLVNASYPSSDHADLDDTSLYLTALLGEPLEHLRTILRPLGEVSSVEQARTLLTGTFELLALLLQVSGLYRWRDQFLDLGLYDQWQSAAPELPGVTPTDVLGFAREVAHASLPLQRRGMMLPARPSYRAIGPALRARVPDPDQPDLACPALRGPAYAATLAYAQLFLAEHLEEQHGLLAVAGQQAHLRLDDAWQGGGVWRAHVPGAGEHLDPADLPLSLGWFGAVEASAPALNPSAGSATADGTEPLELSVQDLPSPTTNPEHPNLPAARDTPTVPDASTQDPADPATDRPPADAQTTGDDEQPDDVDKDVLADGDGGQDGDGGDTAVDNWVDDTTLAWTFSLLPSYLTAQHLPLTPKVAAAIAAAFPDGATLTVDLAHPGTDLTDLERRQQVKTGTRRLTGLTWPPTMFLGMRLTASWSTDSYQISVTSHPLEEPVEIDGIPLDYAFDEDVVLRHLLQDLETPDDVLSPGVLKHLLRKHGRVGPAPTGAYATFVPFRELHAAAGSYATDRDLIAPSVAELYEAVCAATGTSRPGPPVAKTAAVRMSWAVLLTQDDRDGKWLAAKRWPCTPDPAWQHLDPTVPLTSADPAVVLSLHPTPCDRPSRHPARQYGNDAAMTLLFRRAHLMRVPRGSTPRQRGLAVQYARHLGMDPATLDPRLTFVHASGTR